jgi:hypothetical protein
VWMLRTSGDSSKKGLGWGLNYVNTSLPLGTSSFRHYGSTLLDQVSVRSWRPDMVTSYWVTRVSLPCLE